MKKLLILFLLFYSCNKCGFISPENVDSYIPISEAANKFYEDTTLLDVVLFDEKYTYHFAKNQGKINIKSIQYNCNYSIH